MKTYHLVITYTDGSQETFRFPAQMDPLKMSHLVERLLTVPTLSLQMANGLLVVCAANIRSAEIRPLPEKLPEIVLRDVERVSNVSRPVTKDELTKPRLAVPMTGRLPP